MPEAPQPIAPGPPGQLAALTGIRGLAAWLVVVYHMRQSLRGVLSPWAMAATGHGYLAVDLFFMLSGFVLWYTYADRLAAGGWAAARQFWWRRFARIWPLHAVILALFVLFAIAVALRGRDASGFPFHELPLHVLLIQNWGLTPRLAWNDPAWSISTEMAAYLLFPAIAAWAGWVRLTTPALLALVALLLLLLVAIFGPLGGLGAELTRLGLWRCIIEVLLGNLMCLLGRHWRHSRAAGTVAGLACIVTLLAASLLSTRQPLPQAAWVPLAMFTGLLALALDTGLPSRLLGCRPLLVLGEISYATYLSHFLLFRLFKLFFGDARFQIGGTAMAGFLALVLAASWGLYHGVEKPAQAWLNRRMPRIRRVDPAA